MYFVNLNEKMGVHQVALADAMYRNLGENFKFIEFGNRDACINGLHMDAESGIDYYSERPYILNIHKSEAERRLAFKLLKDADVVRTGGEPIELIRERLQDKKLTFRSSERYFKRRISMFSPRSIKKILERDWFYRNSNYRLLCQSAYLANDIEYLGLYRNQAYKFAYFTEIPEIDINAVVNKRRNHFLKIVWCGRFVESKHPEMMIALAKQLIDSGRSDFMINMIGPKSGLWDCIRKLVEKEGLKEKIILSGPLANADVLSEMRTSHIFVSTSDRNEGWGAVVNEAMGSGCACVCSHEIGSVPYLINQGKNGLIFKSKSVKSLFEKVCLLYDNVELRERISREGYATITGLWSAVEASNRLISLSESILMNSEKVYTDGPCSKAYRVDWHEGI